jgi:prevent-host-death family protein
MDMVSITEAKNRLSALLDRVKAGGTVLIVDRGRPVARLESAISDAQSSEGRLARLERAGVARRGGGHRCSAVLEIDPPGPRESGVLEALLDERRRGR